MTNQLKTALEQRYSTKQFDPANPAPQDKIDTLLDTLCLAPTSINSQPWHLFVVTNQAQKARMAKAAWDANKGKFQDASHVLLFCAKTNFGKAEIRAIEELVAQVRGGEVNEQRVEMMTNYVNSMSHEMRIEWLKRQVYLVFGQCMLSAALLEMDSCPIEGFLPEQMDDALELHDKGLTSVVAVAIGQRSEDDFNTLDKAAKVRFPREAMITELA
ncbi:nitroreductase family protein [Aliagarivorans taiwanensis]|uniref:nitroreductase family protein n=1 Tax=Aliagarivorans taiwanensis TaxID=561966 RepID=UPI0004210883|nr:nitroreductase family protein [Aliagarivorans taiwanensis]